MIEARRGRPVCVLASGDPFFFGVGTMLMRRFSPAETLCIPAPSAFALAAARLGWSQQDCATAVAARTAARGDPAASAAGRAHPRALVGRGDAGQARGAARRARHGAVRPDRLRGDGGPERAHPHSEAESFALDNVAALNTIALEVVADRDARILPRAPGLPDEWFEHDGQITKRDIRAITLSALAPRRGETLVGRRGGLGLGRDRMDAGRPRESRRRDRSPPERAARIARNALSLGVPALSVVTGAAPQAFGTCGTPDAIFIGGGASAPGVDRARL